MRDSNQRCPYCSGRGKVPHPDFKDKLKLQKSLMDQVNLEYQSNNPDHAKLKDLNSQLDLIGPVKFLPCICVQEDKVKYFLRTMGYDYLADVFDLKNETLKKIPDYCVNENIFVHSMNRDKFDLILAGAVWRKKLPPFVIIDAFRIMDINIEKDNEFKTMSEFLHRYKFFVINIVSNEMSYNRRLDYFDKFIKDLISLRKDFWIVCPHKVSDSRVSEWYQGDSLSKFKELRVLSVK